METIIDPNNGHNKVLIEKINAAWNDGLMQDNFRYIVYAIAMRDRDEVKEKVGGDYCQLLSDIIDGCDKCAISEVLTNVCDDTDLENILQFVGFERWY